MLPNAPGGWTGANQPTQSVDSSGQTNVNINQNASQAILNWTTFNVGARTTLTFDQHGNASWVALNRVNASTGPSQILGNIKADGTVLIINQSGIIFGGASQINVGSLIASSANITDAQLKTSGIYSTQVSNIYVPSFTGAGDGATGALSGKVIVESGALITTNAPTSVTQGGGYVLLMGTEVGNAGSITTPKGQVELAAGHDFILRPGLSTDSNQSSTTRGNEIATGTWTGTAGTVGNWTAGGGTVSNTGIAFAQQGDITLAGHIIVQDGALVSTTSVNQRGTIHLLNSASDSSGSVTLTGNSLALILPELDSSDIALNSQRDALITDSAKENAERVIANFGRFDNLSRLTDREDQSRIEIVTGGSVVFKGSSLTQAQGGQVAASAVKRISTEAGATIDVSGVQGVLLPMSANEVQINVQGNELRDSPQNRDSGNLANKDVWIDVRDLTLVPAGTGGYTTDRYYTPGGLLEVSGYLNNTAHTIGEWAAVGGSITLSSAEIVAQKDSIFNIAGGSVQYKGGYLQQTYVLGSDGSIYNVNDAPSDITFKAVVTGFVVDHPHWGVTEIYQSPWGNKTARWEDGYTVGRDAGSLILSAPTSLFEGDIVADALDGERQTQARPSGVTDSYKLSQDTVPLQGMLAVAGYTPTVLNNVPSQVDGALTNDIVVGQGAGAAGVPGVGDAVPSNLVGTTYLNASDLSSYRLGKLVLDAVQDVKIAAPLTLSPGGSLNILSPSTDIAANVTVRGGSVTAIDVNSVGIAVGSASNSIVLRSGATIDTRGLWTNAALDPNDLSGLPFVAGGDVTLRSTGDVTTETGSLIDASSGGAILVGGKTKGGAGGDITLSASYAPNGGDGNHGTLTYNGQVVSYGVTKGGALTLETGGVLTIGGSSAGIGDTLPAGTVAPYDVTLTQSITIPAGQILPVAAQVVITTTFPPDVAFPKGSWNLLAGTLLPTSGAWVNIPAQMAYQYEGGYYVANAGDTIPAGATITYIYTTTLTSGTLVFPASVFPSGIPVYGNPVPLTYAAGSVAQVDIPLDLGTVLPKGTVLAQDASIKPITSSSLSASLFGSGFSGYTINGQSGLIVANNTAIDAVMPVYQFTNASSALPTGSDPSLAFSLWQPPTYIENPLAGTLTQRAGVDVTLKSAASTTMFGQGLVEVGQGASITVDPGHSVQLVSAGQITVEGGSRITAHGGNISLLDSFVYIPDLNANASTYGPDSRSFWIGDGAVLDVSGRAYIAQDIRGNSYGLVPDGGTIAVGRVQNSGLASNSVRNAADAFIVIAPGALLDASGASGTLTLFNGSNSALGGSGRPVVAASNGGTISLSSYDGIYAEGMLLAAKGGVGASGGTLDVILETPFWYLPPSASLPNSVGAGRTLAVGQGETPGPLAAGLVPGQRDASLVIGHGTISANQIEAGGFDNVLLFARSAFAFDGDVSLSVGRSLTLAQGSLYDSVAGGKVSLNAPYIFLDGYTGPALPNYAGIATTLPASLTSVLGGTFAASGDLIDARNGVSSYFADTDLTSSTDIRFLAGTTPITSAVPITTLDAPYGSLKLVAEQVYPTTGANVTINAGILRDPATYATTYVPNAVISIESVDGTTPDVPYSVFGSITLTAPTVRQGGVLRAPLGSIALGITAATLNSRVELLPGSLTSVSAAGLVIPYGGTVDGVTYDADGGAVITPSLLTGQYGVNNQTIQGITLNGTQVIGNAGSRLDVSGGGALLGAGFVSGRGGSVDTLLTPLLNSNPANGYSAKTDTVYAIVPGVVTAPVAGSYYSAWTGNAPQVGQQVTVPAGVPGLAAGTYTLLPANYALLPGAYRVELGSSSATMSNGVVPVGSGSYLLSGYTSVADTSIRNALPTRIIVTPGTTVRSYSQYDEDGYVEFQLAQAATFGSVRPLLPEDGKFLTINLSSLTTGDANVSAGNALQFSGHADLSGAADGYGGSLVISTTSMNTSLPNDLVITGPGSTTPRSATATTISADAINAFDAPNVYLGGAPILNVGQTGVVGINPSVYFLNGRQQGQPITLEPGAVLTGSQVVLAGGVITFGAGAGIDTLGRGVQAPDFSTGYSMSTGFAAVAVSNGDVALTSGSTSGSILVGQNAFMYSDGSIGFASGTGVTFTGSPRLGTRKLALAMPSINIGSGAALAAAGAVPTGLNLTPDVLNSWLTGVTGVPAVRTLTLTATNSINFYGSTCLPNCDQTAGTSSLGELVLNSPAIYGEGGQGDTVNLKFDTLVWNGIASGAGSAVPGVTSAYHLGAGQGTLKIDAREIILGYPADGHPLNNTMLDRLTLGFSAVTLNAGEKIVAANNGTLNVFQSGPSPDSTYTAASYAGAGGALNLVTPLLTGDPGAILKIRAGGAVEAVTPTGIAPSTAKPSALGAEIDIASGSVVTIGTTVWLPSGKFSVTAAGDIALGASSRLNLAGQTIQMFDVTKYSRGGDISLESTFGNITQTSGSIIDISATGNNAGTLTLTATGASAGQVTLAGMLRAGGGSGHDGGSFDIRAQRIGSDPNSLNADFAALNIKLNDAGFTESRSFDLKQGSLVIGNELRAHAISVSIDGGALTVNGTVDASGERVGSIRLAARDDLTINGTLDAHGTVLQTDLDGNAVGASNTAEVELTSTSGGLKLNAAVIDLRAADGVARGELTLNTPRTGETSGDIKIDASGSLTILGAGSIALNAFWTYTLPDGSTITQTTLDGYDAANTDFIKAAYNNDLATGALTASLLGKLSGILTNPNYASVFHLRPGVEIDSTGALSTSGDIDLAGYRYGPQAESNMPSAPYGAGEPLKLVIRAGGNLTVNGSISDGFAGVPASPPAYADFVTDITKDSAFTHGTDKTYGEYYRSQAGWYVTSDWVVPDTTMYRLASFRPKDRNTGQAFSVGDVVPAGTMLNATYFQISIVQSGQVPSLAKSLTPGLPAQNGLSPIAAALAPGSFSSSIRLVAGSDLGAADSRMLMPASAVSGGNVLLSNYHLDETTALESASTIRTGAGDLDILAAGNFSQGSIYNISTTGGGDGAPADLFVKVQGNLTSQILPSSSIITNWLNGNTGKLFYQSGFTGFGALNGGNVTIRIGGDAGELSNITRDNSGNYTSTGLVVAAKGGGDVVLDVGGRLNPNGGDASADELMGNTNGVFTDLRGNLRIDAGAIGVIPLIYGVNEINDPRGFDPNRAALAGANSSSGPQGGVTVVVGNGVTSLNARGDLALSQIGAQATSSYWRPSTAVELFSAGGNLAPVRDTTRSRDNTYSASDVGSTVAVGIALPPIFSAVAASGSIYYGGEQLSVSTFRLLPSPVGQLELLAQDSIYGAAYAYNASTLYQPARFEMMGADSDATLHNGDTNPIRVYAVTGDLVNVVLGETYNYATGPGGAATNVVYVGAKATDVEAGRDIVNFGRAAIYSGGTSIVPSLILNTNDNDVSSIIAGRDMFYTYVQVAGPGVLDVSAGRNLYQGNLGSIASIGPLAPGDSRPGATVSLTTGAGASGPDYAAFAALYLNPANQADLTPGHPLADQLGKVAHTYQGELRAWLKQRYGYDAASDNDALAYFSALAPEQQDIFLRQAYFAELKAGGREYNDTSSLRYGSYLRGREAIAALFPRDDYSGNFTMFGSSGVQTLFGGDISFLTPGGQTIIGTEGANPPGTAGVITQGSGDIDIYSLGSVLLGQSRIMTTFGGNILVWSAEGDINAGRGAKTTTVFTPPKRVYDAYGRVTLSPTVPSAGAGIATLNPIPEVPRGDIDLIAPLGTIDAGEAGIRVSGNINLAALQVLNAANIQVQGTSAGLPTVQGPPVAALTSASNTAAATQQSVQATGGNNSGATSVMIVEIIGYGGGDGSPDGEEEKGRRTPERQGYDPNSMFQVVGSGTLSDSQRARLTPDEQRRMSNP